MSERNLELKDIVGYLPYKMLFEYKGNILRMDTIQRFGYNVWAQQKYYKSKKNVKDINYSFLSKSNCSGHGFYIKGIKPILHPMSDLTKPITVDGYNDGKEFVPFLKIAEILNLDGYCGIYTTFSISDGEIHASIWGNWIVDFDCMLNVLRFEENSSVGITFKMSMKIIDILNQCHFDYRGLIDAGLAVDINTLDNQL